MLTSHKAIGLIAGGVAPTLLEAGFETAPVVPDDGFGGGTFNGAEAGRGGAGGAATDGATLGGAGGVDAAF